MSNFNPVDSATDLLRRMDKDIARLRRRRRYGLTSTNITQPPMLSGVSAQGGIGSVTFIWDGSVEEDHALPSNFYYVEVFISPTPSIAPTEANLAGVITTSGGGRVTIDAPPGNYYLAGRIRTTSRSIGPLSTPLEASSTTGSGTLLPAPKSPTNVWVTSTTYWAGPLGWRAAAELHWDPVIERVNGEPVDPTYRVLMTRDDTPGQWQDVGTTSELELRISGLSLGVEHCLAVVAEAPSSEQSARSAMSCFIEEGDAGAPAKPNPPMMSTVTGMVVGRWDRVGEPIDLDHVQFHRAQTADFTPNSSTRVAEVSNSTPMVMPLQAEGVEYFYKLVVVDVDGLESPPSDPSPAVVSDSLISPEDLLLLQQTIDAAAAWIADTGETLETLLGGPDVIPQAVIDHLWANVVRARKITTDMLIVGSGENIVPDPHHLDEDLRTARLDVAQGNWSYTTSAGSTYVTGEPDTSMVWRWIGAPGSSAEMAYPVTGGHTYRIRYDRRRIGLGSVQTTPRVRWVNEAGNAFTVITRPVAALDAWETDEIEWTAPATAVGAWLEVSVTMSVGAINLRRPLFTSKTDGSLIVDGAIMARHVVAESVAGAVGEFVEAEIGNLKAGNLRVLMGIDSDGMVRAGSADGRAAELTADHGLQTFQQPSEPGAGRRLAGQFGGPGGDSLTLYRADGTVGVHLNAEEGLQSGGLAAGEDPVFFGRRLLGALAQEDETPDSWMLDLAQGTVASGSLPGSRLTPINSIMGYSDIAFEAVHGRTYMIVHSPGVWDIASIGTDARVDLVHKWTTDGSDPKNESPTIGYKHFHPTRNGFFGMDWVSFHDCNEDVNFTNSSTTYNIPPGTLRMLTMARTTNCQVTSSGGQLSSHIRVYDMGRTAASSTNLNDGGVDPAPPATVFRSYWEANSHRTFNQNGTVIEGFPSSAAVLSHGIYPWNVGLGQRTAAALFTGANSRPARSQQPGHTNITMNSALNNRTIRKAWLQVWTTETGQSGGAVLQVSQYPATTLPGTVFAPTAATRSGPVRAGTWTTIEIPVTWFDATSERGIKFTTTSTAANRFARYAGSGDTQGHRPRVILEYT